MRTITLFLFTFLFVSTMATTAFAQQPRGGGAPTQTSPTKDNRNIGPQRTPGDDARPSTLGGEPTIQAPADPLAIPDPVAERIGSDYDGKPPSAEGTLHQSWFPVYSERKGDYRLRLLPPLYLEHTRGLDPATGNDTAQTDTESLTGLLFYHRRSPKTDADVLFPLAWRVRDRENKVLVLGPLVHREAPYEHDNWLAPLYAEGKRKDGGYFHSPALLTTSHWDEKGAFTIVGPYFRDRTGRDVDRGVAPLWFNGDNGDIDGARRQYTLIPPLLYFHREHELDQSQLTVVGPVISQSNPKRSILDVAPLFFSINGRPQTGGVNEFHYTLFPFFHYGRSPDQSLFVVPGLLRRVTPTVSTLLTPIYSHTTTRNGATSLTLAGPVLPIYYHATDSDIGYRATGVFPFYYGSKSNTGETFAIPVFARTESYNVSRTYWVFPTLVYQTSPIGWNFDFHPLVYVSREQETKHTVLAPIYWDFASKTGRTTIAFPLYWRFADHTDNTVTQLAGITLYREKPAVGGTDWQFHVLPIFSYGQSPTGAWWNVLFGLAGYDRDGPITKIKAFWLPITVADHTPPQLRQRPQQ